MDIQVNDVSKIYGTGENKVIALCHANMTIHSGDFISIMGPSGSGKSTLLHIISGLDTPTSGKVLYGDTDIHHGSDKELSAFRRQKIGFIFQQFNLLPVLTAQENIIMPLLLDKRQPWMVFMKICSPPILDFHRKDFFRRTIFHCFRGSSCFLQDFISISSYRKTT